MYHRNVWTNHAILLEACARSQTEHAHGRGNNRNTDHPWVRAFLDAFALVAADPGEAPDVTAVCLEVSQDEEDSKIIRVAKNEEFDS